MTMNNGETSTGMRMGDVPKAAGQNAVEVSAPPIGLYGLHEFLRRRAQFVGRLVRGL